MNAPDRTPHPLVCRVARARARRLRAPRQRRLSVGRCAGARPERDRPGHRAGRVRFPHRSFGLRQDDLPARHRRSGADHVGNGRGQRHESARGAAGARLRLRLPGAGAVPLAHRPGQRHAAAADPGARARRVQGRGDGAARPRRSLRLREGSTRGSSRAACSSASRSPARSASSRDS